MWYFFKIRSIINLSVYTKFFGGFHILIFARDSKSKAILKLTEFYRSWWLLRSRGRPGIFALG